MSSAFNSGDTQRAHFAAIVESADEAIISKTLDGTITSWNRAAEQMYGFSADEAIGSPISIVVPDHKSDELAEVFRLLSQGRRIPRFETVRRRKDGSELLVALTISPLRDVSGRLVGASAISRDITRERRAEELLEAERAVVHAQAQELAAMFELSGAGIAQTDPDGYILRANKRFAEMTGYSPADLIGMRFTEVTLPEDRENNLREYQALFESGGGYSVERRMLRRDGTPFFARVDVTVVRDAERDCDRAIAVLQDVTDSKLAEAELARAKRAAEKANRAKDEFLAVLSHELRTPLTPVLAAVAKLERTEVLSEAGKRTLRTIQRNVELESRLIDDLLDLTRIARGRLELRTETLDAAALVRQVLEMVGGDMDAKELSLAVELADNCWVRGDAARIQQVCWNLLNNAIKFTPAQGRIRVRVCCVGQQVHIEVEDTGVGIDTEFLPHVFDAFEQGRAGEERKGLGLGLAITNKLVELHGGSIRAFSEGKNRGATFRVELPRDQPPSQRPSQTQQRAVSAPHLSLRVLLVEDNADSAELLSDLLTLAGHRVTAAADMQSARKAAEEAEFDLLVSDLGLPDGSGLDLVRELRAQKRVKRAIALSGYGMEEDLRRSREAGFDVHLVKPVSIRDLRAAILRVTGA